jgi:hypothetical protein
MRIPKFTTTTDPENEGFTIVLIDGERFGPSYDEPVDAETVCRFLTDLDEDEWTTLLSAFNEARSPQKT